VGTKVEGNGIKYLDASNKRAQYLQEPMRSASYIGAVSTIYKIKDAFAFIHGPVGCKFLPEFTIAWHTDEVIQIGCTYLDEASVVMGAMEKLRKALVRTYHDRRPRLLAVVGTDTSSMIGEDVPMVIKQVQPETPDMKLIYVDTAGFRGDYFDGVEQAMIALVDHVMEEQAKRHEGSVNLVGDVVGGPDQEELLRVFQALNIPVNCVLTAGSSTSNISRAPAAQHNVCLSREHGLAAARQMQERYGIGYTVGVMPYGIKSSYDWYAKAAEALGRGGVEEVLAEEARLARQEMEPAKRVLAGKAIGIIAPSDVALALAHFVVRDLEMNPLLVGLTNANEGTEKELARFLAEHGLTTTVITQCNLYEIYEFLATTPVDMVLGSEGERYICHEKGIPVLPLVYPRSMGSIYYNHKIYKGGIEKQAFLGFRGAVNLAKVMVREYQNPVVPLGYTGYEFLRATFQQGG